MRVFIFLLTVLLSFSAQAATWYVKPSASGSGTGASAANAMAYTGVMAAASAGDVIIYCGGAGQFGSINWTKTVKMFSADVNGVTNKWSAEVVGSPGTHAIYGNDGVDGTTVWGFKVVSAYVDGIKTGGNNTEIRDCWVAKAGRGDPAWVTNTSGIYNGQGIGFHDKSGTVIENCLVENCGAKLTQDHGLYGNGTNVIIRGNIVRSNCAWGMQIYNSPGDNDNVVIEGNLVHDNGTAGTGQSGITFQTHGAKVNNRIVNNTIVARTGKYGLIFYADSGSARVGFTNNIVVADSGYGITAMGGASTNTVWSDYNLKSAILAGEPQGAHDVQGTPTFDSEANGRYWLTSGSAGRGIALASAFPAIDFFRRAQYTVADAGFAQYETQLDLDDTRNLGDGARDPWVREAIPFNVSQGAAAMELSWTEPNQQHAFYYIQRKDSVNNTFAILATVSKGVLAYSDPLAGLTNGVTYTYTTTPETSLGNSGGIHSINVAVPYNAVVYNTVRSILDSVYFFFFR